MNKKIIIFLFFFLMVSFSSGVFVQFLTKDFLTLSANNVSFWQTLWSGCKSDFIITLISLILSTAVYTTPLVVLLMSLQVFTLGFSASYLLAAHPQGISILLAVLLPRCLIKLPVYILLIVLSFRTAKQKFERKQKSGTWHSYIICYLILMFSSLLEACLYLLIVSP